MPTWTQKLAIGVAAIDKQHQQLFARADALIAAMKQGRPSEEVRELVTFLKEYCQAHFSLEEKLMRDGGFKGRAVHEQQHRLFTSQFEEIVEQFTVRGPSLGVTIELQDLICSWLVNHIGSADVELAGIVGASDLDGDSGGTKPEEAETSGPGSGRSEARERSGSKTQGHESGFKRSFQPVYILHGGKRILRLDYTGLSPLELIEALELAGSAIATTPPTSLRILSILAAAVTSDAAEAFKRVALANREHVFASAVVGTSFWKIIVTDLQVRGREDLMLFDREAEALDWLASR